MSMFIQPHIYVGVFGMLQLPYVHTMSAAPVSSGQSREKGVKLWMKGGEEQSAS